MEDISDEDVTIGLGCALETFKEYEEISTIIENLPKISSDQTEREKTYQRFLYILNLYQEQPHLLDLHLDEFLKRLLSLGRETSHEKSLQHLAFKLLYVITKVRGYKVVVRHLPHEVSDVESVLHLLSEQDPHDYETWETRYILLLWMSIIVMLPMDMTRLDDNRDLNSGKKPVMERIMILIKLYLSVGDKARDAASFLSALFFTRPDVGSEYLSEYIDWCMKTLTETDGKTMSALSLQAGVLSSLALLFKHGKREDLKEYGPHILKKILECDFKNSMCTTVRKMALKLLQRIGLSFLKLKACEWRYDRGTRSLTDNLAQGDVPMLQKSVESNLEQDVEMESEYDDEYDVSEEIEDIVDQLLAGLRDKDTVLRWSAAKGIGRITSRLSKELADDIVSSVLKLFSFREIDTSWHGGCLALAELSRRGLILPQHLKNVVNVVLKALVFDQVKGNFSVGAHVRDAACYVCWSFARAYDPIVLQPFVTNIAGALLVTTVFDREINCRRAASAAFQENVGRQGTFPHGIDIVTVADYYAVGCRRNAFLNLSAYIGKFPEYTVTLLEHLLEYKINHWDAAIRELSSKALHNLAELKPIYVYDKALPKLLRQATSIDLNTRHGALLAVAEIIFALHKVFLKSKSSYLSGKYECVVDEDRLYEFRSVVITLKQRNLFQGIGGVLTRIGACLLIEKASYISLPYQNDEILIETWLETIDSSLEHNDASVRTAAISALSQFAHCFYSIKVEKGCDVLHRYVANLNSQNLAARCGYVLAIGALPKFILQYSKGEIIYELCRCIKIDEKCENWAEFRRDAIKALVDVATTLNFGQEDKELTALDVQVDFSINSQDLEIILPALLIGLDDYTLDSRGEIGAIVREAAMLAIPKILCLIKQEDLNTSLKPYIVENIFKNVLQQCVEKIDRTRSVAGSVFSSLLHSQPCIPHIPEYDKLLEIFPKSLCDNINWGSPSDTFHLFVKLLPFEAYTYNILLGFTVSVGGLTESLVKYSRSSLVGYLKSLNAKDQSLNKICDTFIDILRNNLKNDRILVPFIKMMDHLLISGIFCEFTEDSSFNEQLVNLVWQATSRSSDPQKLIGVINLFSDLLQFPGAILKMTMSRLSILLCHRFPRIRILTAHKLYEAFVSYDIIPSEVQAEALIILSDTDWNQKVEHLRPIRNKLCEQIGIPVPTLVKA